MTQVRQRNQVAAPEMGLDGSWRIGADVLLQSVFEWEHSPEAVRWGLSGAFSWQERNETTVNRVLKSASLAPQFVAALLALGAHVVAGEAEVSLADYLNRSSKVSGPLAIKIAPADGDRCCGHAAVSRTPADRPIVAAVACVSVRAGKVTKARLGLTGVWTQPVGAAEAAEVLCGETLTDEAIGRVATAVEKEVRPCENFLGSSEYRRAMAGVLTRRALGECLKGVSG